MDFRTLPPFKNKPSIAILIDICNEPDDTESMTRLHLYTNEFHIRALIATTSTWQRTFTHASEIHRIINAYSGVVGNLNSHVPPSRRYPEAEELRKVVRDGIGGYGMEAARGMMSEGTKLLVDAIDGCEDIIWVLIWSGANVLAQALLHIQTTRTQEEIEVFARKIHVYAISDQDDAGPWIRLHFPKMFYIASIHAFNSYGLAAWTGISGETMYGFHPGGPDTSLVTKEWIKKNIQIGPYGSIYPDPVFIPEGDTPTFLSLIQNGLTDLRNPDWGGWGGRYKLTDATGVSGHYSDAADSVIGKDGRKNIGSQATIWRWREAYQGDFAARIQWTLSPEFGVANHAPVVVVNGDMELEALRVRVGFGGTVRLDASKSWDPDGDELTFKWMHYREPSTTQWNVDFEVPELKFVDVSNNKNMEMVEVRIPGKEEGFQASWDEALIMKWGVKTYHFILEVVDNRRFPMRAYRRILVEILDE